MKSLQILGTTLVLFVAVVSTVFATTEQPDKCLAGQASPSACHCWQTVNGGVPIAGSGWCREDSAVGGTECDGIGSDCPNCSPFYGGDPEDSWHLPYFPW